MTDTPDRPTPLHPRGMVGLMQEQFFGPPPPEPEPDPVQAAAAIRQLHRDELRDTLDVAQRIAVFGGLVVLELLVAVLLAGLIRVVW